MLSLNILYRQLVQFGKPSPAPVTLDQRVTTVPVRDLVATVYFALRFELRDASEEERWARRVHDGDEVHPPRELYKRVDTALQVRVGG